MKEWMIRFFKTAGGENRALTAEEHRVYLKILDDLMLETPDVSVKEMQIVLAYIERSIRYYLTVCAHRKKASAHYEGCMENLIFLTGYFLHFHSRRIRKEFLLKIYEMSIRIDRLDPCCYAEVADYVIRTGLLQKIHFFIEYYYP